jgi:molybdopterin molybdotransferase
MTYPTQISVLEALTRLQARAPKLAREEVPLGAALGRTLAAPLRSRVDHPSLDNSALDGYACRAADTSAASRSTPVTLHLVGDVPAGSLYAGVVGPGEAVAIYTGAPMPTGADAIIGVELTERGEGSVTLFRPASPRDIRPRAQDLRAGEVYLEAGRTLGAAEIAVAAAMGHAVVPVVRRPRVGILATGDELVEPGDPIRDGQVYNSNSYGLAALVAGAGGEPVPLPNVRDDLELLEASLDGLQLDLLLTSGGVSMGRYDFVRDLLFDKGTVHFWKVAMKPGGPVLFGSFRDLDVLGLPGNPVSSLVVFTLLGRAYLAAALGSSDPLPYHTRLSATAETPFAGSGFKETFARATLTLDAERGYLAASTGSQSSGVLRSLLSADALAVVPPHTDIAVGERLEVIPL